MQKLSQPKFRRYFAERSLPYSETHRNVKVNIMVPDGDDYLEKALAEQFKTLWDAEKKQMVTEPMENTA